jgi:hypothetical protein
MRRSRKDRVPIVAASKAAKCARGECADCFAPAAFKKNGKRARLCDGCLKKDRERATVERKASRTAPEEYG